MARLIPGSFRGVAPIPVLNPVLEAGLDGEDGKIPPELFFAQFKAASGPSVSATDKSV